MGNWLQILFPLLVVLLPVLQGLFRYLKEQAAKQQAEQARKRREQEMLRTGRTEEPDDDEAEQARIRAEMEAERRRSLEEIAEQRRKRMEEIQKRREQAAERRRTAPTPTSTGTQAPPQPARSPAPSPAPVPVPTPQPTVGVPPVAAPPPTRRPDSVVDAQSGEEITRLHASIIAERKRARAAAASAPRTSPKKTGPSLSDPDALRQAIIASEILGKPVSLREEERQF